MLNERGWDVQKSYRSVLLKATGFAKVKAKGT